ncbi:MAG: DUF11 domain-containing protein, partial [Planctomycetes bacterium]|nr:DUF11 domain-containing protein [Planctomycetota bacterium]
MVARVRQASLTAVLAAGLLGLLGGCFGVSGNPSYFPYLLPTGDIIRTHAKPPGAGYYADFDPHSCRLEVRPLESTDPVQTQHVFLATIYDDKGVPRRDRRIEWMLEGVGNIVEVDESGYFPGRGYKVDNKYAVSYTDYHEHHITRGNANPNDDFVIRPGQSWCVISSAVEGDSHLTVYAPEIANWDAHKVFVTDHWVDAEWTMPPPGASRAGTQHVFSTTVFRHTDHKPLAGYRVRYRILDGPPARFLPDGGPEAVATTNLDGNAPVGLAQVSAQGGVNRIGIEIIRPPDPRTPSGAGITIGHGETTMEWSAPTVTLTKTGPPGVGVGQEVPYAIALVNTGKVETQGLTVRDTLPEGLQYLRSEPPAIVENNQLIWTLAGLTPGAGHNLSVTCRAQRVGPVTNRVLVTAADGVRAESSATTQITSPQLNVRLDGPTTGFVNMPLTFQVSVSNPGTGPAANVVLVSEFDPGLEHETRYQKVELPVGNLQPGETKLVNGQPITLTLTPRRVGRLGIRVTAMGDGNLTAHAEQAVDVRQPQLALTKTGPAVRYVDQSAVWELRVVNQGEAALTNVVVRDQLPPELGFVSATQGGQLSEGQVLWSLGNLAPGEQRAVQVTTRCLRITPRTINQATATADPGVQVQAQAALEVRGLPAYRLEVSDTEDPVEVGSRTTYQIEVTNQGSLPGNQVEVIGLVPPEMRLLNANGPSQPRIDGARVYFPPVDNLQPKAAFHYTIEVQAVTPGDARFRVELRSETLKDPVIKEESTNVYPAGGGPGGGAGAGTRPPSGAPGGTEPPPAGPSSSEPPPGIPVRPEPAGPVGPAAPTPGIPSV